MAGGGRGGNKQEQEEKKLHYVDVGYSYWNHTLIDNAVHSGNVILIAWHSVTMIETHGNRSCSRLLRLCVCMPTLCFKQFVCVTIIVPHPLPTYTQTYTTRQYKVSVDRHCPLTQIARLLFHLAWFVFGTSLQLLYFESTVETTTTITVICSELRSTNKNKRKMNPYPVVYLYFRFRPIRYVSCKTDKNISEQITEIICRFMILTLPWQDLISLSHSLLDFSSFLSSSSFPPR